MSILCSLPFAAAFINICAQATPFATGYVEGKFTLVAPVSTAQIISVEVVRGDKVPAGAVLVELEKKGR